VRLFLTTILSVLFGAMGSFDGELGMPMDARWESGELKIDLAIAVSEYQLQT
jgi:hypothetical protein